jgi:hypothetical protein
VTDTLTRDTTPDPYADPPEVIAQPLILNDAYFELTGQNLRCLVRHLEIAQETSQVSIATLCGEVDYPGVTKWHLRITFAQSFDANATFQTLNRALAAYRTSGAPAAFKARPFVSRPVSATNPEITGFAIPQEFNLLLGDAGAASDVEIDWSCREKPSINDGAIPATGATAGAPGFYTPAGATVPANLAALSSVTASPTAEWASGQYVITNDLLAAHWDGTTWATGKA